ncbi:MAG: SH3 domain-containing protein [Alphaproteobacteria bacterium]|nr:SH3 domain-containing protein [Alphaproteobacteria bacterium]
MTRSGSRYWPVLVAALTVPLAATWGAEGDVLVIIKDRVNLRSEPNTEAAIVEKIVLAQKLTEVARTAEWVQVRLIGSGGAEGWVHASLVGPDAPAIDAEAVAAPEPMADLESFKLAVTQLNAAAKAQGYDLYGAVTALGKGLVQVVVTDRWIESPESFRKGNLEALFAIWDGMDGGAADPIVRLVDGAGEIVMERASAPAAADASAEP